MRYTGYRHRTASCAADLRDHHGLHRSRFVQGTRVIPAGHPGAVSASQLTPSPAFAEPAVQDREGKPGAHNEDGPTAGADHARTRGIKFANAP